MTGTWCSGVIGQWARSAHRKTTKVTPWRVLPIVGGHLSLNRLTDTLPRLDDRSKNAKIWLGPPGLSRSVEQTPRR